MLDPSHGPRQVAALGSSKDSLRLVRRGPGAMRAPQYQIVAVKGLIETEEQFQVCFFLILCMSRLFHLVFLFCCNI